MEDAEHNNAEKRCRKCGRSRPLSAFGIKNGNRDGHSGRCLVCRAEDARDWYRGHKESHAASVARWAAEHRDERLAAGRAWNLSNAEWRREIAKRSYAAHAEERREHTRRFLRDNRDVRLAHKAVYRAVHSGVLTRCPCAICGETKRIQAHHEDYARRLDVVWLCPRHHKERHARAASAA